MTDVLTQTQCTHCGIFDDHPKLHFGITSYHHDCAPHQAKLEVLGGAHSQHALIAAKIFKACEDGKRGEDLRGFIAEQTMADHGDAVMIKSTTIANAYLDAVFNGGASGTVTVGAQTLTLPYKCKFLTTVSTAGAAGTEWSTSGGYTAGGVSLSGAFATAAASGSKSNTAAVTVTNAPGGTWADNEIVDSSGTPVRLNAKGTPSLAKTVNAGDTCTIPIGSLTGSET